MENILRVKNVEKYYGSKSSLTKAINDISFEEFCNIFKNIYESSQNPNKIFLEGFCYMDKDK